MMRLSFSSAQSRSRYRLLTGMKAPVGNWFCGHTYAAVRMFVGSFSMASPSSFTGMLLMLNPQSLRMLLTGVYPGSSVQTCSIPISFRILARWLNSCCAPALMMTWF